MKIPANKELIINIKRGLKSNKSSVAKLCKDLGVNRNYINQIKPGVGLDKVIRIANAIGCTPSELIEGL